MRLETTIIVIRNIAALTIIGTGFTLLPARLLATFWIACGIIVFSGCLKNEETLTRTGTLPMNAVCSLPDLSLYVCLPLLLLFIPSWAIPIILVFTVALIPTPLMGEAVILS